VIEKPDPVVWRIWLDGEEIMWADDEWSVEHFMTKVGMTNHAFAGGRPGRRQ
jgi:hypothetical protein